MIRTLIQWCYYTFGWFGCTKVSPGCKNCYMFALAKRRHKSRNVGPGAARVLPKYFQAAIASLAAGKRRGAPFTWDRQCEKLGIRRGVFPSLCDPFDDEVPIEWFTNLLRLIHATPHLDWLLLTKRPENFASRMGAVRSDDIKFVIWALGWMLGQAAPQNVWVGVSVENQECADRRITALLQIPSHLRFLSCEPLLEELDLMSWLDPIDGGYVGRSFIDWVIVGGESGNGARPTNVEHIRNILEQCADAGVPVFVKQLGSLPFTFTEPEGIHCFKTQNMEVPPRMEWHWHLKHEKGGEMAEWPEDLRVRKTPKFEVPA